MIGSMGMKKLLIVGIVCLALGVLSLLIAVFSRFSYYHVMDGSSELYTALHRRMIVFGVIGLVLAVIGAVCLIIRSKTA